MAEYNGIDPTLIQDDDPEEEKPKIQTGGLDELFQGVYSSVVEAQNVIEQHYLEEITKDYFDEEGKPKMIVLELPGDDVYVYGVQYVFNIFFISFFHSV